MTKLCCNKPLILFSDFNSGVSATTHFYHCDACGSFYKQENYTLSPNEGLLEKTEDPLVQKDFHVYKRLCTIREKDANFDVNEHMQNYNHFPSNEEAEKYLEELLKKHA